MDTKDETKTLDYYNEQFLLSEVVKKYDYYDEKRNQQKSDNRLISNAIYNSTIPAINNWDCKIQLPEIYELATYRDAYKIQKDNIKQYFIS